MACEPIEPSDADGDAADRIRAARARQVVRDWPELTPEQQARLRELLAPVITPERADATAE